MSQMANMLEALAAAIEARGTTNINESFILNVAQREWIATSLRHEAARLLQQAEKNNSTPAAR